MTTKTNSDCFVVFVGFVVRRREVSGSSFVVFVSLVVVAFLCGSFCPIGPLRRCKSLSRRGLEYSFAFPEVLMLGRRAPITAALVFLASTLGAHAAGPLQSPEQFVGFRVGSDNKLVRWDKIVDYMKLASENSDR